MSEFGDWIPTLGLLVALVSVSFAILTYLRVSRKYHSKTLFFHREFKPKEDFTLFNIRGAGNLQKIEMTGRGSPLSMITATLDGLVFLRETFRGLEVKRSPYVKSYMSTFVGNTVDFSIEMDLQKNFFKNIELSIENRDEKELFIIKGAVHFNIYEPRFHLRPKRKSNP